MSKEFSVSIWLAVASMAVGFVLGLLYSAYKQPTNDNQCILDNIDKARNQASARYIVDVCIDMFRN